MNKHTRDQKDWETRPEKDPKIKKVRVERSGSTENLRQMIHMETDTDVTNHSDEMTVGCNDQCFF